MILTALIMQVAAVWLPYSEMRYCYETRDPGCRREVFTPHDLALINLEVTDAIITDEDLDYYDPWTPFPIDRRGDCGDDAATKRAALLGYGFDPKAMRFEIGQVTEPDGRVVNHIVLVVTIDGVEWVMDRKTPAKVYEPSNRPYLWRPLARQTPASVVWQSAPAPAAP